MCSGKTSQKPLQGLKILDFTGLLPGPFASFILADLGADVIRIEAPSRPDLLKLHKPSAHRTVHRGKRSIFLNLKDEAGKRIVHDLIDSGYDILLEAFRPGVMERLNLGYQELSKTFPGLIFCSISGYGQNSKAAKQAGHDINYQALSGVVSIQKSPQISPVQPADLSGSLYAVISILAAVHQRNTTGPGQSLDVNLTQCMQSLGVLPWADFLETGRQAPPGAEMLSGGSHYDYYECSDGKYLALGALEPEFLKNLATLLEDPEILGMQPSQMKDRFKVRFLEKSQAEWIDLIRGQECCLDPVLDLEQSLRWSEEMELDSTIDIAGARQLSHPVKYSGADLEPTTMGAEPGTHTREVLLELGYSESQLQEFMKNRVIALSD